MNQAVSIDVGHRGLVLRLGQIQACLRELHRDRGATAGIGQLGGSHKYSASVFYRTAQAEPGCERNLSGFFCGYFGEIQDCEPESPALQQKVAAMII
jgi:hypothetical protein